MTDRKELYASVTAQVVRQIEVGAAEWRAREPRITPAWVANR
jgi:hypothetical protein